ncbi:unnamed protein product [Blepharisma stoltei]|uniref:Tubby C-terminal domain-containing protein n=1 Tax=Blepharisma stoltei TaxID=1481888 RepID=A0AAU9JK89_9CILI|nr:unnamed protein product [Blepharisma stoltei]
MFGERSFLQDSDSSFEIEPDNAYFAIVGNKQEEENSSRFAHKFTHHSSVELNETPIKTKTASQEISEDFNFKRSIRVSKSLNNSAQKLPPNGSSFNTNQVDTSESCRRQSSIIEASKKSAINRTEMMRNQKSRLLGRTGLSKVIANEMQFPGNKFSFYNGCEGIQPHPPNIVKKSNDIVFVTNANRIGLQSAKVTPKHDIIGFKNFDHELDTIVLDDTKPKLHRKTENSMPVSITSGMKCLSADCTISQVEINFEIPKTPIQEKELPVIHRDPDSSLLDLSSISINERSLYTPINEENSQSYTRRSSESTTRPIPRKVEITKIPTNPTREFILSKMIDLKAFVTRPVPKGITLQCSIKRVNTGIARFYPKYYLYFTEGWKFLLAAKKRAGNRTANYMLTIDENNFSVKSNAYLGKLRSNFIGNEFVLYDTGKNPKSKGATSANVREELGAVLYESNIMGPKAPRKMTVLIPEVDSSTRVVWKPMKTEDSMVSHYGTSYLSGLSKFINKPPSWNEFSNSYHLNFSQKAIASVKNFQIISELNENKILLQLLRIGDQHFSFEIEYPFSPLQAFGVAISSFDNKLCTE